MRVSSRFSHLCTTIVTVQVLVSSGEAKSASAEYRTPDTTCDLGFLISLTSNFTPPSCWLKCVKAATNLVLISFCTSGDATSDTPPKDSTLRLARVTDFLTLYVFSAQLTSVSSLSSHSWTKILIVQVLVSSGEDRSASTEYNVPATVCLVAFF